MAEETCLACGGALATVLGDVYDTRFGLPQPWRIARCGTCGLEQTLPRPAPAERGALYARHYNFGGERGSFKVSRHIAASPNRPKTHDTRL